MNGFHGKHIFFTRIGENFAQRLFQLEWNKTHFSKNLFLTSLLLMNLMQNAFF